MFATTGLKAKTIMHEISIETEFEPVYGRAAGETGCPLVLGIHGWSQRNGWHTWAPLLEPLAQAGYFAVSVDMPGWGDSLAWSDAPLTVDLGLTAVEAIVLGLGYPQAAIMGKSWGGGIALELALRSPGKVKSLILSAPAYRDFENLKQLIQPVLLAWSKDDPVIPYRYAKMLTDSIRNVELVAYETGGHSAAPKNAEQFAPIAIDFLNSY